MLLWTLRLLLNTKPRSSLMQKAAQKLWVSAVVCWLAMHRWFSLVLNRLTDNKLTDNKWAIFSVILRFGYRDAGGGCFLVEACQPQRSFPCWIVRALLLTFKVQNRARLFTRAFAWGEETEGNQACSWITVYLAWHCQEVLYITANVYLACWWSTLYRMKDI